MERGSERGSRRGSAQGAARAQEPGVERLRVQMLGVLALTRGERRIPLPASRKLRALDDFLATFHLDAHGAALFREGAARIGMT